MTRLSSTIRLGGIAALALLLTAPTFSTARADDEYGTGQETVIRGAASSTATQPSSSPGVARSWGYENEHEAMIRSPSANNPPGRVSSTVPTGDGKADVVGAGGPQDRVNREIYHPGSGTGW